MKTKLIKIVTVLIAVVICLGTVGYAIPEEGISFDIGRYSFNISGFRGLFADAVADRTNTYEIIDNGDGTAWIRAYIGEETEIVIPPVIDGLTITEIGPYAFSDCVEMTSVVIPDTVTEIGDFAFYQNLHLSQVTLPDSVSHIGYCAFGNTPWQRSLIETSEGPYVTVADSLLAFKGSGEVVIPSHIRTLAASAFDEAEVTRVVIPEGVTYLPGYTFFYCDTLKEVVLPSTLTEIGNGAFRYCSSLEKVNLENVEIIGGEAFSSCEKLEEADLSCATEIGAGAFENCSSIGKVTFGAEAVSIKYDAFNGCTAITSINIPGDDSEIYGEAFSGCASLTDVEFSENIALVVGTAFNNTPWLENNEGFGIVNNVLMFYVGNDAEVTVPSGVKEIREYVFSDNEYLTKITLPDSVEEIGYFACYGCSELNTVNIPESVRYIRDSAFRYCTKLTSIDIPEKIEHIGDNAFYGTPWYENLSEDYVIFNNILVKCNRLDTEIVVPDGVTWICEEAFDGYRKEKPDSDTWETYAQDVTSIYMPDTVTHFGGFEYYTALKEVTLPASLTELGDYAFYRCEKLESVVIPNNVNRIGKWAFNGCTALESVIFSDNIGAIGDAAFGECFNLKSVTLPRELGRIGQSAFEFTGIESVTMYDNIVQIGERAFKGSDIMGGDVYYNGSISSWDRIDMNGTNYDFLNSNIHYITSVEDAASDDIIFTAEGKAVEPESVELVMNKTANEAKLIDAIGADSGDCYTYDISLRDKSGNEVQIEKGTVECVIPFSGGASYDNRSEYEFALYHFADGTEKEQLDISVERDGIKFEADSFSPYILVCEKFDPDTVSSVSYDANGGVDAPESQIKKHDIDLVLSTAVPTREGYMFTGWNTESDGSGISYAPGAVYTLNEELMLYAQWSSRLPGDVNSDGKVDMKDSTVLRRYLAEWEDVDIDEANADVNGDGEVTLIDSTILRRYLAKWDGVALK